MSDHSPHVDLLGGGPERLSLEDLARALGVGDQCHSRGRAGYDGVLSRMGGAMVTVLPSRGDNCPFVTIEAFAVGAPLVVSGVGGLPEIIGEGRNGFLVPRDDPEALVGRLSLVLCDEGFWAKLSLGAHRDFLKRFGITRAAVAQANWLETLVSLRAET